MNYYRFSDLTISMTCRYDIMKRRAEKYLIPKAKENELSETTTPEIRLNPVSGNSARLAKFCQSSRLNSK